jgi:hypothetical protein
MAKRQKNRQHNGQKTEEHTTQWPKDRRTHNTMAKRKTQKDKQRSTKQTYKTKVRVARTLLTTGDELNCYNNVYHKLHIHTLKPQFNYDFRCEERHISTAIRLCSCQTSFLCLLLVQST